MRAFWRRPRARGLIDDGVALISVIGAMTIVTLFLLTGLALVLTNAPKSRQDQDAKTAVAAAEAGVEDYVSRLNADDNYWTNGNADPANAAFSAAGRVIPGTGTAGASYTYQVLNSSTVASSGRIVLQVTGTSSPGTGHPAVSRTITAILSPKGFLRYVYFSDVEVMDPALMSAPLYVKLDGSSGQNSVKKYAVYPEQACGLYYYAGRYPDGPPSGGSTPGQYTASAGNPVRLWKTTTSSWATSTYASGTVTDFGCNEIQFASGDVISGPLHSNDAIQIGGSVTFSDPTTESSWPECQAHPTMDCWWTANHSSPSGSGYDPHYAPPLSLPAGNQGLLRYVEPRVDDPGATPGPGCYYTGNTEITFVNSSPPKMQVLSPATTSAPSRCLDVASRSGWQTKDIPPVIYVDATTNTGDYSSFDYPMSGEDTSSGSGSGYTTDYSRTRGTAFVKGTVSGQVTIAAKDDVVVTGDLTTASGSSGTDIVGLVAGNYVWVYHPVNSWGLNLLSSSMAPHHIEAAILSLRHSFLVQKWDKGSAVSTSAATRLNVTGSISQKYRGPVGTGDGVSASSGYLKNYVYDSRLLVMQPPYFLKPDSSPWQVVTMIDK